MRPVLEVVGGPLVRQEERMGNGLAGLVVGSGFTVGHVPIKLLFLLLVGVLSTDND